MSDEPTRLFTVEIPTTPQSEARPNRNTGWSKGAGFAAIAEKKRLRQDAARVAKSAMVNQRITCPLPPTVHLDITVYWEKVITPRYPNGRYRSRVDNHDTLPMMCKGIVDGLVDAGLIPDDRDITAAYTQKKDPDGAGFVKINVHRPLREILT